MPQDFVALKHLAFFSIGSATRPKNSSFGITVLRAHEFCTILPKSMGVSILFGLALMLMMELEALRIAMFVVNFMRACTCHHQATADSFESCVIQWFMIQPRMYNNTTNPKSLIPHCYHCIFIRCFLLADGKIPAQACCLQPMRVRLWHADCTQLPSFVPGTMTHAHYFLSQWSTRSRS